MSANQRLRNPLQGLPALAHGGSSPAARRYRREHRTAIVSLPRSPWHGQGGDGVRRFRVIALRRPVRGRGAVETVPCLRLSGRWLEELGFTIGARVTVEAEGGRLVLKSEAEEG
jgi:hypothetical protein